jgi:ATP-dependent RNA helicase DeaD
MSLKFLPGAVPAAELNPLGRYRSQVRARIERGGTDAELLVLEPLVREFGTARVAAALSDLLRRSQGGDAGVRPWADVEAASRGGDQRATQSRTSDRASGGAGGGSAHRGARGSWSRVFIGAGNRDSVRVGDLVGAITGETGIAGAQIGKIEIRGSFSLVEIDSQVVDQVVTKLNGTAIRGREVSVKLDRGS